MHPTRPIRLLSLLLLSLLLLSPPPVSRADAADDAGVYVYIPQPVAGQPVPMAGEGWPYEITVYATLDDPADLTLTLLPDTRVDAAAALTAGPLTCGASGMVVCRGEIARYHPIGVWLVVIPRPDAIPCPPLEFVAQATAGGHTARRVHAAASRSCIYAPLVSGGS